MVDRAGEVAPDVRRQVEAAADALEEAGAIVTRLSEHPDWCKCQRVCGGDQ